MSTKPPFDDLPVAIPVRVRRLEFSPVWLIPILAALIGTGLGIQALLNRGPVVTITFDNAEGLEAGKTKVRFKDVEIGEVTGITLSKDRSKVLVKAEFIGDAEDFLVDDTEFWVVRPRITGGEISGVSTLFSGSYIALKAGDSEESRREFQGLETAPILTSRLAGQRYILAAKDLGSLDVGAPIYYRHIRVGEVTAFELEPNGRDVHLQVFIHAPYDRYVTEDSRFWNASGFDVTIDSKGARLDTESLVSILSGGIAFETPPGHADGSVVARDHLFPLFSDRVTAMKTWTGKPETYVMEFSDSLKGLSPGALIEFRGIPIGEVTQIDIRYDDQRHTFSFPVTAAIYEDELVAGKGNLTEDDRAVMRREILDTLMAQGLRAQIRSANILTGTRFIALDYFQGQALFQIDWQKNPIQLPTIPGSIEELELNLGRIIKKIDKIPFEDIGRDTQKTLESLNTATQNLNQFILHLNREIAPETTASLVELRKALSEIKETLAPESPLQRELRRTLYETTRSVKTIRSLADTLESEPESLIRGKAGDP